MEDFSVYPLMNDQSVDNLKEIMADNFSTVIQYYIDGTTTHLQEIEDAMAVQDTETVGKVTHSMKSSSLQIGAERIAEISKTLENIAKTEPDSATALSQIQEIYPTLKETFDETLELYKPLAP